MSTPPIEELAAAKVNLALHVTGRREDGYHLLDSVVVFAADAGDRVSLAPAARTGLELSGPFAAGLAAEPDNLVLKAHRRLAEAFPGRIPEVAIRLDKRLPVASGIGGGSADAAAVLRGLGRLAGLDAADLAPLALGLGADVPVCLAGRACRMRGIGEVIEPFGLAAPLNGVLVNPRVAMSTAAIFAALAVPRGGAAFAGLGEVAAGAGLLGWLAGCRNDLEPPALRLAPVVGEVVAEIAAAPGCRLARMSGSGATCFGLFDTAAAAADAARRIGQRRPAWWVVPTALR